MKAKTITLTALLALCTNYSSGMEKEIVNGVGTTTAGTVLTQEAVTSAITPEMSLAESVRIAADPKNFSNINPLWMNAVQKMNFSLLQDHFDIDYSNGKAKEVAIDWGKASQDLKKVLDVMDDSGAKTICTFVDNTYTGFLNTYTQHTENVKKIYDLAQKLVVHSEKGLLITCTRPKDKMREEIKNEQASSPNMHLTLHFFENKEFISWGDVNGKLANQLIEILGEGEKVDNNQFKTSIKQSETLSNIIDSYIKKLYDLQVDSEDKNKVREKQIETLSKIHTALQNEKILLEDFQKNVKTFVLEDAMKRNEEFLDQYPELKKYSWCSIL